MNFLLIGINAQYFHSSLGVRSIYNFINDPDVSFAEYTINQRTEEILKDLYFRPAEVYMFSCYIWNISMVKELISQLIKIKPSAKIILGGPEASYKGEALLEQFPFITAVGVGEGEQTVTALVEALKAGSSLVEVAGLYLKGGYTPTPSPLDMDSLCFNYSGESAVNGKILYYESMRGCPYSCSYCLSSVEKGVRMRSLARVCDDLERLLELRPRQVKFVDRTFNCDAKRAEAIWSFLIEKDNGHTNFHFELAGDIIKESTIQLLSGIRLGLFQFEIGVQSTNPDTLRAIKRSCDLDRLKENVDRLTAQGNIHLHLDLIAGLPYEGYESFASSFGWVYALKPQQLQLGFLKVLGGSMMAKMAEDYGIAYTDQPPYQVLATSWLSYEELSLLCGVEQMVDSYYNSGRFTNTVGYLEEHFDSPYSFYLALYNYYDSFKGEGPLSKQGYYQLLGSFAEEQGIELSDRLKALCRYDIMLHEKPKSYPEWAAKNPSEEEREEIREFYQSKENIEKYLPDYMGNSAKKIERITHGEVFAFDPKTGKIGKTMIIFDYSSRDILGNAGQITLIK